MFNAEILIVFIILGFAAFCFITGLIRSELVAILVVVFLLLSGVLDIQEALSGLSSPSVVIIMSMFIVSAAIEHTGIAQSIGEGIMERGGNSETRLLVMIMLSAGLVGAFMSSSATVAIFLPITLSLARRAKINKRRMLMPLAVASLISGMMTLVATTPNIIVNSALRDRGLETLSFFSFTPYGCVMLLLAIGFTLLCGRHMLSQTKADQVEKSEPSIMEMMKEYGLEEKIALLRVVDPDSEMIESTVAKMQIREKHGLNLIAVQRIDEGQRITLPVVAGTIFREGDILVVIGSPQHITSFEESFHLRKTFFSSAPSARKRFLQFIGLAEVMLTPDSNLLGKTLRQIQFQKHFKCLVLGIRGADRTITEDIVDQPLKYGDVLLVSGAWHDILRLNDFRDQYLLLTLPEDASEIVPGRRKEPVTLAVLAGMVFLMAFNLLPTLTAVLCTVAVLLVTGCASAEGSYKSIDWQTVFVLAGILPLAGALQKTGGLALLSEALFTQVQHLAPILILAILFLLTAITGLFMANSPTAILLSPVAIDLGLKLNIPVQACAMVVAIASSAAFMSPFGSPVNMIIHGPGGYSFLDFLKVGIPLLLISLVATLFLTWALYLG